MTDRELLELAAKAAGYDFNRIRYSKDDGILVWEPPTNYESRAWNPLNDDGDALRLAVKCGLSLERTSNRCWAYKAGMAINGVCEEFYVDDPLAETRRAIVRAAAELGRTMP